MNNRIETATALVAQANEALNAGDFSKANSLVRRALETASEAELELVLIDAICVRAMAICDRAGREIQRAGLFLDICNTHEICPLRLAELAVAREETFVHDVFGIWRHYDRVEGTLSGGFLPRTAHDIGDDA